ncbi:MAG: N-acetyltransferase [Actinomycetota bacterium]|nr:MAG: N-acetyltransferase [Actinomycetota bacterium]
MSVEVTADAAHRRFVVTVDGARAGELGYRDHDGVRTLIHTEVDPAYGGRGLGGELARAALEATRAAGLTADPQCPFVARWLTTHPGYEDLLTAG